MLDLTEVALQGRGGSTGYDNAVALPARSDSDELEKENNKSVAALKGQAVFSIAKVHHNFESILLGLIGSHMPRGIPSIAANFM